MFFKNASSSISHKYSVFPKFRNFSKILCSTFNCLWTDFEKNLWMLTLRRHIFYIKWSVTSMVTQCHIRWHFYSRINFFFNIFLFVYAIDWLKQQMPLNIMKNKERILGFLTFRLSDLLTTLTYVLKDNFCPCLFRI